MPHRLANMSDNDLYFHRTNASRFDEQDNIRAETYNKLWFMEGGLATGVSLKAQYVLHFQIKQRKGSLLIFNC